MSIGKKLLIAFNLSIIITNIAVVVSYSQFRMIDNWYSKTIDYGLPQIVESTNIELSISKQSSALLKFINGYQLALYDLRTAQKSIEFSLMHLKKFQLNGRAQKQLEECNIATQEYEELVDKTITLYRSGDVKQALHLIENDIASAERKVSNTTNNLTNAIMTNFQEEKEKAKTFAHIVFFIFTVFLVLSFIVGIAIIYFMYRWINSPMNKLDESFALFAMEQLKQPKK